MTLKRAISWCIAAVVLNAGLMVHNAMIGGWWHGFMCLVNAIAVGISAAAIQDLLKIAREESDT